MCSRVGLQDDMVSSLNFDRVNDGVFKTEIMLVFRLHHFLIFFFLPETWVPELFRLLSALLRIPSLSSLSSPRRVPPYSLELPPPLSILRTLGLRGSEFRGTAQASMCYSLAEGGGLSLVKIPGDGSAQYGIWGGACCGSARRSVCCSLVVGF